MEALERLQQQTQLFEIVGHRQDGVSQALYRTTNRQDAQNRVGALQEVFPDIQYEIRQVTDGSVWWGSSKESERISKFFAGEAIE